MNIHAPIRALVASLYILGAAAFLPLLSACDGGVESALQAQVGALSQTKDSKNDPIAAKELIAQFYAARSYKPVWNDEKKRDELRALVHNTPSHGLNPEDYHAAALDRPIGKSDEDKARADILYTDALARLAYHLRFGKVDPNKLYADWNYQRSLSDVDPVKALESLANASDLTKAVEDFGPQLPEYTALRQALVQYYAMAKTSNSPEIEQRIDTLKVNLERIRWVAYALPKEYVLVDVAGYSAALFRDGKPVWTSRVMVGKPYRETPVFRSDMTQIVLNPTWTVPPTILKEDILSKLDKDPDLLARKGLQVIDDKGNPSEGGYHEGMMLRQAPGPTNPLGRYKFDMPNEHTVYLHDTPAKEKFEEDTRALSSGCIRLEKPRELAQILLSDQMSEQQIDDAVATGETKIIALKEKIPVLILYFTAEANGNEVTFRPDIYERDPKLAAALKTPYQMNAMLKTKKPA